MNVTSVALVDKRSTQRTELQTLLLECDIGLDAPLDDQTPLISSGLVNSLALFRVALWVEEKIGGPVDPSTVDFALEWDSIEAILDFVDRSTGGRRQIASPDRSSHGASHSSRWQVVRYTPDYKPAVAALQTNLWCPDVHRSLQYFEWKYESNPCSTPSHIYLALEGDRVIGMRGFHPSRWESGRFADEPFLVADDSVVSDDHRSQGVMDQIMREARRSFYDQGIEYVFNFSGSPVTVVSSLAAGWRIIGAVTPIRRQSRMIQFRDRIRSRVASTPFLSRYTSSTRLFSSADFNPFVRIDRLLETTLTVRGRRVRVSRQLQPDKMAQLIRNISYDGRIRLIRGADYLKWRFANPLHEYRYFFLEDEDLSGYLVVKRSTASTEPSPTVHIVDLEAKDDDSRLALLEAAAGNGLFDALIVWSATLTSPCQRFLAGINFSPLATWSPLQGHPCLLVRTTGEDRLVDDWNLYGVSLTTLQNWDMRMIYSMAG